MLIKEIYSGRESKEKLIEGIEKLAEAVLCTMGPNGKTVIISDEYDRPYITKDGVSVANSINFKDPVENIAAKLVKEVSQKTAEEAGDGTTTSICLVLAFIRQGIELLENEVSIIELQNGIDKLLENTLKELKKSSRKLSKKNITNVATISANNDIKIGKLITEAYKRSKVVRIEEGTQLEDSIETLNGMNFDTSYYSSIFINDEAAKSVNYNNSKILLLDKKLEDLTNYEPVLRACVELDQPLIIFTEFVTDNIINLLRANERRGLKVAVIKTPGFGERRKEYISDISAFTGAEIVSRDKQGIFPKVLGEASQIIATRLNTTIVKHSGIDITEKVINLQKQKDNTSVNKADKEIIQERIDNLAGSLSIIKVGGNSELEMKERKDRIEDAVLAVKSALEEGIVEGGGLALNKIGEKLLLEVSDKKEDRIYKTLLNVLFAPSFQIYSNSHRDIDKSDMFKKGIIDPLKVTRCALENAASVAKTILSTESIVLNERLWNSN